VLPKKFNQYLFIPPPLNVGRSTHRHFNLLFSLLPFGFIFKVTLWSPHSTLVNKSCPSKDPWANVDYYYFFLSSPCKMGGKVTKPKSIKVTETNGFKEEDHSWSIVNIHLACAVNTVLSLCAVICVHSVPAQVIARLYSSHFSTRENVAAKSQEIVELYNRHFPDAWYSMPENAVANAVALTANAAAGTDDAVAETADAIASIDDAVDNADNNSKSSFEYHMDDEAYDATYDDRNWRKLQREADAEADEQHYYT
jgi:hypothetical protein